LPVRKLSAREIYRDLRQKILIRDPGYRPGDRLPSQNELAGLYEVSRGTIVAAMLLLSNEGLVQGRGGAGTWVLGEESAAEDYLP
jgi:DNA-binding GntR family transcriptional regulator